MAPPACASPDLFDTTRLRVPIPYNPGCISAFRGGKSWYRIVGGKTDGMFLRSQCDYELQSLLSGLLLNS
jgi:hypothetical protein